MNNEANSNNQAVSPKVVAMMTTMSKYPESEQTAMLRAMRFLATPTLRDGILKENSITNLQLIALEMAVQHMPMIGGRIDASIADLAAIGAELRKAYDCMDKMIDCYIKMRADMQMLLEYDDVKALLPKGVDTDINVYSECFEKMQQEMEARQERLIAIVDSRYIEVPEPQKPTIQ